MRYAHLINRIVYFLVIRFLKIINNLTFLVIFESIIIEKSICNDQFGK